MSVPCVMVTCARGIRPEHGKQVFRRYVELRSVRTLKAELDAAGICSKGEVLQYSIDGVSLPHHGSPQTEPEKPRPPRAGLLFFAHMEGDRPPNLGDSARLASLSITSRSWRWFRCCSLRWTQPHPIRRAIEANVAKGSYIEASFVAPHIHADVLNPYAILFLAALVPAHPVAEAVALRD